MIKGREILDDKLIALARRKSALILAVTALGLKGLQI
jgi:hypothetical protein